MGEEHKAKKLRLELDPDDAKKDRVTDDQGKPVPSVDVTNLTFNGKRVVSISDGAVIRTHESPGCITIILYGQSYTICT
jgi:hypothetical protein